MSQISVYLQSLEVNYIIKLFTKLVSVDTKLLLRCCDRMRYVIKHNNKKIFFPYVVMLMRLLLRLR